MSDKTVKQGRRNNQLSTQRFLPFSEVKDNLLILKNWWIRAVLKASSVNFNLKSETEQNSLIIAYQGFLNSLNFPIQIVIRSKKLDIDNYIHSIENIATRHENRLLQEQTMEYASYIKKLVEYANIMEKQFYVIVPVDWISNEKKWFLDFVQDVFWSWSESASDVRIRLKKFEKLKKKIKPRIDAISTGLESIWIEVNQLPTTEIIKLFYQIYNPDISRNEKNIDTEKENLIAI